MSSFFPILSKGSSDGMEIGMLSKRAGSFTTLASHMTTGEEKKEKRGGWGVSKILRRVTSRVQEEEGHRWEVKCSLTRKKRLKKVEWGR